MVGCVFVSREGHTILSTGYNGSPRNLPHCYEVGCDLDESGHCVRTIHAEINAIVQAARDGISLKDSEVYSTMFSCYVCFKAIANVGVKTIYYDVEYKPKKYAEQIARVRRDAALMGVKLVNKKDVCDILAQDKLKEESE